MDFRTTFSIDPSPHKITYLDPVMFLGSCFASEIGSQLEEGRIPVLINPAGAVYNPVSVRNILEIIIDNREFTKSDLYNYNGSYISFFHNTAFSSPDPEKVLERINGRTKAAHEFLASSKFLFITFGTARVYRLAESGMIVSNCHKLPQERYKRELLTVEEIVRLWSEILDRLHTVYPHLHIVFTISPVRHWKDGAHANQVSKSVLILAVEKLLAHSSLPGYFPAYELLLDDLRDYRYYDDDMLHPSSKGVEYIWEAFARSFIESETYGTRKEVVRIVMAARHRILTDSPEGIKRFAEGMLGNIGSVTSKIPSIDLSREKDHFLSMLKTGGTGSLIS